MKNFTWSFIILIIFSLAGFFLIHQPLKNLTPENIKYVKIAGLNIKVDLALTKEAQAQGLSGRSDLKTNEGMLFVFPQSGNYPFWMKNMNFSIDIIWLNENRKVIYIKKDARPELYPEIYGPDVSLGSAKYVLEILSGFSEKNNLKVEDRINFTY